MQDSHLQCIFTQTFPGPLSLFFSYFHFYFLSFPVRRGISTNKQKNATFHNVVLSRSIDIGIVSRGGGGYSPHSTRGVIVGNGQERIGDTPRRPRHGNWAIG